MSSVVCARPLGSPASLAKPSEGRPPLPISRSVHATLSCLGKQASSAGNPWGQAPAPLPETPSFYQASFDWLHSAEEETTLFFLPLLARQGVAFQLGQLHLLNPPPPAPSHYHWVQSMLHIIDWPNLHTGAIRYVLGDEETETPRG